MQTTSYQFAFDGNQDGYNGRVFCRNSYNPPLVRKSNSNGDLEEINPNPNSIFENDMGQSWSAD